MRDGPAPLSGTHVITPRSSEAQPARAVAQATPANSSGQCHGRGKGYLPAQRRHSRLWWCPWVCRRSTAEGLTTVSWTSVGLVIDNLLRVPDRKTAAACFDHILKAQQMGTCQRLCEICKTAPKPQPTHGQISSASIHPRYGLVARRVLIN
jgi:hypothetical protein